MADRHATVSGRDQPPDQPSVTTQLKDDWVRTQPADRNPLLPDMTGIERENISLEPGDLMIFNSLLAHGVRP